MIDRRLRATVLLTEAAALGLGLEDLIAAHTAPCAPAPTLADHVDAIAPTFSAGTAATYRSYWRLAVEHLGDRRLTEISVVDPLLNRAQAAGLIATNPAAGLRKPRRVRSRRRALDRAGTRRDTGLCLA